MFWLYRYCEMSVFCGISLTTNLFTNHLVINILHSFPHTMCGNIRVLFCNLFYLDEFSDVFV